MSSFAAILFLAIMVLVADRDKALRVRKIISRQLPPANSILSSSTGNLQRFRAGKPAANHWGKSNSSNCGRKSIESQTRFTRDSTKELTKTRYKKITDF